ncbi:MAG: hypothetical protein VB024_12025 [Dysgonamonadaceae bacterium]|jgi:hypothetical protein|nr:hypothetical protein [Dysgonamonadaceae bacterium]MDD3901382.1 hypothetical protein [Dysgonamonadaceae bacterium]MDD4399690.1 hypothetical protein [Dysgonamonadaceae bacterium]MEA5082329.1 hypothetical protein [Dysgonamonadaceae bacterium]
MKKNLFLIAIAALGLFFTSCLGGLDNDSSYAGSREFAYIDYNAEHALTYAVTPGRLGLITSPEIKQMAPGTTAFISYSWTSKDGYVSNTNVYNVTLTEEPEIIPGTSLILSEAPESVTPFNKLNVLLADQFNYFGNRWLFTYDWKKKEGETSTAMFYLNMSNFDRNSSELIIDVRFVKSGTATGTKETLTQEFIALNLSALRDLYETEGSSGYRDINVKFRYNASNSTGPVFVNQTTLIRI